MTITAKKLKEWAKTSYQHARDEWEYAGEIKKSCCRLYGQALAYLDVAQQMGDEGAAILEETFTNSKFGQAYKHAKLKEVQ